MINFLLLAMAQGARGAGGVPTVSYDANLTNRTVDQEEFNPPGTTDARAWYRVDNDGRVYYSLLNGSTSAPALGEWKFGGVNDQVSDYEVRCTVNSGTLDGSSSATGTWLACTTDREWGVTRAQPTLGNTSAQITVEIRNTDDLTVHTSATIDLTATISS